MIPLTRVVFWARRHGRPAGRTAGRNKKFFSWCFPCKNVRAGTPDAVSRGNKIFSKAAHRAQEICHKAFPARSRLFLPYLRHNARCESSRLAQRMLQSPGVPPPVIPAGAAIFSRFARARSLSQPACPVGRPGCHQLRLDAMPCWPWSWRWRWAFTGSSRCPPMWRAASLRAEHL